MSQAQKDQIGMESNWGGETKPDGKPSTGQTAASEDEAAFYELFWEVEPTSMQAYLEAHPEALENGWENLYINEAGLDDEGTSIKTIQGEQVLAIDMPNQCC